MAENGDQFKMATDEIVIPNIEAELSKLWMEGKKKGEIKACLFNLILYSQNSDRSVYLKEVAGIVKETFPCRLIFIECDDKSEKNYLTVSVAEDIYRKDSSIITCDRIEIKCSKSYINRVPYLVLPHLIPDLPVYLLWGQDPSLDTELLPHLQKFATRLIFDSDSSGDIRNFCNKMLSDKELAHLPVTDMNWASLASWREILFQVFDTKEKIEHLRNCKEIKIRYNSAQSPQFQHTERRAVYLQGWIASQLKWKYKSALMEKGELRIKYDNGSGETIVDISGNPTNKLTPGSIMGFEVFGQDQLLYFLRREGFSPFVVTHISKKDECELPFILPLRHFNKGSAFMQEMFFAPCSGHYWSMLKAIQPLQVPC
jgi:glucose-6-phosphate dehydrogenase assembly protein OpcA